MSDPSDKPLEKKPPVLEYAPPLPRRRRLPRAWVLIVPLAIVIVLVLIAAMLPKTTRTPIPANLIRCQSHMRQIGLAMLIYAQAHGNQFPDSLLALYANTDLVPDVFICPSSSDMPMNRGNRQAVAAALLQPGRLSYVYVGSGLTTKTAGERTVVLYELPVDHGSYGANVLFGDARVETWSAAQLRAWLADGGIE